MISNANANSAWIKEDIEGMQGSTPATVGHARSMNETGQDGLKARRIRSRMARIDMYVCWQRFLTSFSVRTFLYVYWGRLEKDIQKVMVGSFGALTIQSLARTRSFGSDALRKVVDT